MKFLSSSPRPFLLKGLFGLLMVLAAYVSAYLAIVQREPYYGNLLQLQLAVNNYLIQNGQRPIAPLPPTSYFAKYLINGRGIEMFFDPIHELDRLVRPTYWLGNRRRGGC